LLDPEAVFAHFAMLHFAKAPRGVVLESQFFMEGSTSEAQAKVQIGAMHITRKLQ
jgi:hypothetical protein